MFKYTTTKECYNDKDRCEGNPPHNLPEIGGGFPPPWILTNLCYSVLKLSNEIGMSYSLYFDT